MKQLPDDRCGKILSILLMQQDPIIIKTLAKELDVSNRTISNDLKKLQQWLNQEGIKLTKKPGVGVWLEINDLAKQKLEQYLLENSENPECLSPIQRQRYILKRLLQVDIKYTVKELADELYVSRATVYKDLKQIEEWLSKYQLTLNKKDNHELEIEGAEKNWRKLTANLLTLFKDDQELKEVLEEVTPSNRIDFNTYYTLKEIFSNIALEQLDEILENILEKVESELNFLFTDEAFTGLVIHIAISIERLKENKDIEMEDEQLHKLQKKDEFEIAQFIADELNKKLGIKIPKAEIGYICLHILGAKSQQNINTTNPTSVLETVDTKIIEIANNIITMAEEILNVNLQGDEQLLLGLVLHLRPAINRLKYGLSLRNPLLDKIKNKYPSVFGAAWATSIIFEHYLGIKVKEEEVGYIALHLGAALERNDNKFKIILVCGSGIGTAQLVASKLVKRFVNLEIVEFISAHKLKDKDLSNIDFLISTIPLGVLAKPVVQVNPLLTEKDISSIRYEMSQMVPIKTKQKLDLEIEELDLNKTELLDTNLIFINLNLDSKEEIIEFLSKQLLKYGSVREGFTNSVLEREVITSTEMVKGIAIPHGHYSYITESKVVVATLAKEIVWENQTIDTVFLLALNTREESKRFFKTFRSILEDDKLLEQIKNTNDKEEMKKLIVI